MEVVTACTLDCPDRCAIRCRVEEGAVRLAGDPAHPYTRGFVCQKIRRYPARLRSPHRIREPWLRRGHHLAPATWDEALDAACAALDEVRRENPASLFFLRGNGSMGVSKTFGSYLFGLLGARGTAGSLCDAAGVAAVEADAGALRMNDPHEIDRAEAVVLWGKNPRASSVHCAAKVAQARRRGTPVLAVNPDRSAVASLADRVVGPRPGTDRFLALAVAKLLLAEGRRGPPWESAANRPAFEALLAAHGVDDLLAACDVRLADAKALAALYAGTPRVATIVGWGLQRHAFGCDNLRAVHALAFLAGTLGVDGGGLYYSVSSARHYRRPQPPPSGARDLVLPDLAAELGRADPPVRFAWLSGANPLNQAPDVKALAEAFAAVETVVCVEPFWTETARRAAIVLPPALWLEEEDLAASYWHRGVGAARRVVAPPEGCRTDFAILAEVARRLGVETPYATVDDWLAACLPPSTPDLAAVRERGWWLAEEPPVAWRGGFAHPDGRFRLLESLSPEPAPDPVHPLRFLTLVRPDAMHSQLLPEEQRAPLAVRIHPDTAARLGLEPGCAVRIASATGEIEGEAHLDPGLHPDAVACPRGGWVSLGLGVNEATEARPTDEGPGAAYYATRVRLERAPR